MGLATEAMMAVFMGESGRIPPATLLSPPIPTGMTDTMKTLSNIIKARSNSGQLVEVPTLLRRVRDLLRVFYDAQITRVRTSEFRFCDMQDMNDILIDFHRMGLALQLDPPRLRALMTAAPDMENFLFDEPVDIGKWREEARDHVHRVRDDAEATDEDRERAEEHQQRCSNDLAAYRMSFLYSDIFVAFLLNRPRNALETRWADSAMKLLVRWSTVAFYRDTFGDCLSEAMRPIYWDENLLVKFCQAGGIAAIVGDSVNSNVKGLCDKLLSTLPDRAWSNQRRESIALVMHELLQKIDHEGIDIVTAAWFARMMHNIFSQYGYHSFARASEATTSLQDPVFHFLKRRLGKKDGLKPGTLSEWKALLVAYTRVPEPVRKRHHWATFSLSARWDLLTQYGCQNPQCSERRALLEFSEKRVRGNSDPEVEERLRRWGCLVKNCARCLSVAYCCAECQRAHWPQHKAECVQRPNHGPAEDF